MPRCELHLGKYFKNDISFLTFHTHVTSPKRFILFYLVYESIETNCNESYIDSVLDGVVISLNLYANLVHVLLWTMV